MAEIIGIGSAVFDTLMTADGFPQEDTKIEGTQTRVQGGGPCATALVAAGKLGVSSAYWGTLGDDLYGRSIQENLQKYGVDTRGVRTVPGCESFHAFILLNTQTASRTCVWSKGTVPPPTPEDVDVEQLAHARFLHLDGHHPQAAAYAAEKARGLGVQVSLDAGGAYPGIERLLELTDILIPSEECALKLTGCTDAWQAAQALAKAYRPETLIVTQGSRGGFRWTAKGPVRYPAFPVKAVDTNGAGDTFHGAYLAGRAKGLGPDEAASFASAVSALKCTRLGAQEGIPTFTEAMAFWGGRTSAPITEKEC